jgi:hypothetical protein
MARTKIRSLFEGLSSVDSKTNDVLITGDIRALASSLSGSKVLPRSQAGAIAEQLRELIQELIEDEKFFTNKEWERFFYNLRALEDKKSIRIKSWIVEAIDAWYGVDASDALGGRVVETCHMPWPVQQEMKWILVQPPTGSSINPTAHSGHRLNFTTNPITKIVRPKKGSKLIPADQPWKKPIGMTQALKKLDHRTFVPSSFTRLKAIFMNDDGSKGQIGKGLKIQTRFEDGRIGKYLGGLFTREKDSCDHFYEQPSFFMQNSGWEPVRAQWTDGRSREHAELGYGWSMKEKKEEENATPFKHAKIIQDHEKITAVNEVNGNIVKEVRKIELVRPVWIRTGQDNGISGADTSGEEQELSGIEDAEIESSCEEKGMSGMAIPPKDQLTRIFRLQAEQTLENHSSSLASIDEVEITPEDEMIKLVEKNLYEVEDDEEEELASEDAPESQEPSSAFRHWHESANSQLSQEQIIQISDQRDIITGLQAQARLRKEAISMEPEHGDSHANPHWPCSAFGFAMQHGSTQYSSELFLRLQLNTQEKETKRKTSLDSEDAEAEESIIAPLRLRSAVD